MNNLFEQTDILFWDKHPELKKRKLTGEPEDAILRKEWMDIYISIGGQYFNLNNVRIAKLDIENLSTKTIGLFSEVDNLTWKHFPELKNQQINFSAEHEPYRKFWMEKYIELGGEYFQVGKLRIATQG